MFALIIGSLLDCALPEPVLSPEPLTGPVQVAIVDRPSRDSASLIRSFLLLQTTAEYGRTPSTIHACASIEGRTITVRLGGVYPPPAGVDYTSPAAAELPIPRLSEGMYRLLLIANQQHQTLTLQVTSHAYALRGRGALAVGTPVPVARLTPGSLYVQCGHDRPLSAACLWLQGTLRDSLGFQVESMTSQLLAPWLSPLAPRGKQQEPAILYFTASDSGPFAHVAAFLGRWTVSTGTLLAYSAATGLLECKDGMCHPQQ